MTDTATGAESSFISIDDAGNNGGPSHPPQGSHHSHTIGSSSGGGGGDQRQRQPPEMSSEERANEAALHYDASPVAAIEAASRMEVSARSDPCGLPPPSSQHPLQPPPRPSATNEAAAQSASMNGGAHHHAGGGSVVTSGSAGVGAVLSKPMSAAMVRSVSELNISRGSVVLPTFALGGGWSRGHNQPAPTVADPSKLGAALVELLDVPDVASLRSSDPVAIRNVLLSTPRRSLEDFAFALFCDYVQHLSVSATAATTAANGASEGLADVATMGTHGDSLRGNGGSNSAVGQVVSRSETPVPSASAWNGAATRAKSSVSGGGGGQVTYAAGCDDGTASRSGSPPIGVTAATPAEGSAQQQWPPQLRDATTTALSSWPPPQFVAAAARQERRASETGASLVASGPHNIPAVARPPLTRGGGDVAAHRPHPPHQPNGPPPFHQPWSFSAGQSPMLQHEEGASPNNDGSPDDNASIASGRMPRVQHFQLAVGKVRDRLQDLAGFETVNGYCFLEQIGRGTFGSVWVVQNDAGEKFAMKVIRRLGRLPAASHSHVDLISAASPSLGATQSHSPLPELTAFASPVTTELNAMHLQEDLRREIAIMKKLTHRNIVPLYEVIDDRDNRQLMLRMKYIPHGPIITLLRDGSCGKIDENTAAGYLRQIVRGLDHLHSKDIVHRDIKPSNLLLERSELGDTVYITDFGVSENVLGDGLIGGRRGTPAFFAPELLRGEDSNAAVDMWALGVTYYCMVVGQHPFFSFDPCEMERNILSGRVVFPPSAHGLSSESRTAIQRLLAVDPRERMTVQQLRQNDLLRTKLRVEKIIQNAALTDSPAKEGRNNMDESLTALSPLSPIGGDEAAERTPSLQRVGPLQLGPAASTLPFAQSHATTLTSAELQDAVSHVVKREFRLVPTAPAGK